MIISKLVCGTLAACATDLWSGKWGYFWNALLY
jgi:hypothetical protein